MRLFRIPQDIIRTDGDSGYHRDGKWISTASTTTIPIKCSIQPYSTAKQERMILPSGFISKDAQVIFTKTQLKTVDQFSVSEADRTFIDGLEYVAMSVKDWSRLNIRSAHYEVLFVRREQNPGGTL